VQTAFDEDILQQLRMGRIVIVDLSLGDESVQRMYTQRITRKIFQDSMRRFTQTEPNNFIQFTFEEAHNLFPKKEDKDLSQIYNRLAKEGAKLNLGLVYATQEVTGRVKFDCLSDPMMWDASLSTHLTPSCPVCVHATPET
jgi:DNA helicase HerA-like ATPase